MAKPEEFENHCWKDVIPPEDLTTYHPYARETYIGERPALLAIDLYNLVYKGGDGLPHELDAQYPNSCGKYANDAIEPTKRLFAAARAAGIPVFYVTAQFSRTGSNRPDGARCRSRRMTAKSTMPSPRSRRTPYSARSVPARSSVRR